MISIISKIVPPAEVTNEAELKEVMVHKFGTAKPGVVGGCRYYWIGSIVIVRKSKVKLLRVRGPSPPLSKKVGEGKEEHRRESCSETL